MVIDQQPNPVIYVSEREKQPDDVMTVCQPWIQTDAKYRSDVYSQAILLEVESKIDWKMLTW